MSEANKDLVRRVQGVFDSGNLDALDELTAADLVSHDAIPGTPGGLEGAKAAHQGTLAAFPDYKVTIQDLIAERDRVVVRTRLGGTHKIDVADIVRYDEQGRAVEHWGVTDMMAMMQQLGVAPAPGA